MADQEEVEQVQDMLGGQENADEHGYDAAKIEALLDGGNTANEIAATFWERRYAATSELIDMSESGSSRGLSAITKNARDLAAMYRKRTDDENPPALVRRGIRSHLMRRA